MRKLLLMALMPIAMIAQQNVDATKQLPQTAYDFSYQPSLNANQVSNADALLLAQISSQIAHIAANIAQDTLNFRFANIAQTINDIDLIKRLTSNLGANLENSKFLPKTANLVDLMVQNINYLSYVSNSASSSAPNSAEELSRSAQIVTAASRIAQIAAQTAQEVIFVAPSAPTNVRVAARSAQSAAKLAYMASLAIENTSLKSTHDYNTANVSSNRANNINPEATQRIREIVAETIRSNPELIRNALASATSNSRIQELTFNSEKRNAIFSENNQLILGNPYGDITVVAFNDYNCGYCKQMSATLRQAVQEDPNLKVLVKEAPVVRPESALAAKAAVAAKRQGMYANFRQLINQNNAVTTPDVLAKTAKSIGLNPAEFQADLNNPEIERYLQKNVELARSLGINSTPAIIVSKNNGQINQLVSGVVSLEQLKSLVQSFRNSNN